MKLAEQNLFKSKGLYSILYRDFTVKLKVLFSLLQTVKLGLSISLFVNSLYHQ